MIIWLIALVIIPIMWRLTDAWFEWDDFVGYIFCVIPTLIIFEVIAFGLASQQIESEEIYEEKQYNICGLENKTNKELSFQGRFVLGCGRITGETNTEEYYVYFKESEYGKILEKTPMDKTYVREKEGVTPALINIMKKTEYKKRPILSMFFISIGMIKENTEKIGTILEVPTGTIKIEYNVDI